MEDKSETRLCKHKDSSCIIHAIKGFIRGLIIGYGLRAAIGLVGALLMRRLYRNPKKLFQVSFLNKEPVDFALFLGFYNLGFKATNCLLRNIRKKEDGINSAVAGAVAGMSMMFWKSSEIALYISARAAESIFNALVQRGYVKSWYHGDSLLFALSTAFMFYAFIWEPENLRSSYYKFLMRVSNGRDVIRDRQIVFRK